jgi:hypothetical protein
MENLGIYKAITGVMADVGAVGKNGVNRQQGFKFRSIDDVMNALHPAMVKNKVFTVPEILEQSRELKKTKNGTELIFSLCKIKYTFYAEDGSFVEAVVIGEGMDSGDKATNKAMAIAYKYACFQVFCIPTEEMIDPDSERPEMEQKKASQGNHTQPQAAEQSADEDPKVTTAMIATLKKEMERTGVEVNQILKICRVGKIEEMTTTGFNRVMKKFEKTPDKEA